MKTEVNYISDEDWLCSFFTISLGIIKFIYILYIDKNENSKFYIKEFQSDVLVLHLKRIADFLCHGCGVWWKIEGEYLIFNDGDNEENFKDKGPPLMTFETHLMKDVYDYLDKCWENCVEQNIPNLFNHGESFQFQFSFDNYQKNHH